MMNKELNAFLNKIQVAITFAGVIDHEAQDYIALTQDEGNELAAEAEALQKKWFPVAAAVNDPLEWNPSRAEIQNLGPI